MRPYYSLPLHAAENPAHGFPLEHWRELLQHKVVRVAQIVDVSRNFFKSHQNHLRQRVGSPLQIFAYTLSPLEPHTRHLLPPTYKDARKVQLQDTSMSDAQASRHFSMHSSTRSLP